MIRILCYGDSNTWGLKTGKPRERYDERYPKTLQKILGDKYEVIEEGLCSRSINSTDSRPNKEGREGASYVLPCLDSHDPLDIIIVMLGTNELKEVYNNEAKEIAIKFEKYIVKPILNRKSLLKENYFPKLVIMSPPLLDETTDWASRLYKDATQKAKLLNKLYSKIADKYDCHYIDNTDLDLSDDGCHITIESHIKLAKKLEKVVKNIIF